MVSEEGFKARYNSELANELGNLVSRTTSMIGKYRGGAVPAPPPGSRRPRVHSGPCRLAAGSGGHRHLRHGAGAAGRHGPERRARDHLGLRPPAQPVRRRAGAVEAGQGGRGRVAAAARQRCGSRPRSTPRCGTWPKGCACCRCCFIRSSRRPRRPSANGWAWRLTAGRGVPRSAPPDPSWDEARWGLLAGRTHRRRRRPALPAHRGLSRERRARRTV